MAGFFLKNTLSENGAVTRGICETNEEGYLTAVHETSNIVKTPEGAAVDDDGQITPINAESYASMNMWGLTPEFMQTLGKQVIIRTLTKKAVPLDGSKFIFSVKFLSLFLLAVFLPMEVSYPVPLALEMVQTGRVSLIHTLSKDMVLIHLKGLSLLCCK